MRRSFKIIIILMIISAILCSSASTALAISDNALWEEAELCPFLEAGEESNSDLCFAAVKVKYDRSINRIYLLFTLEFNEFNNIESCGVIMNFNGMGNIKMMCDGTADLTAMSISSSLKMSFTMFTAKTFCLRQRSV